MNAKSTGVKLASIAVLTLALLIPVLFVNSTLSERRQLRDGARDEITSSWGTAQQLVGPVLIVPYEYRYTAQETKMVKGESIERTVEKTAVANASFLPTQYAVSGSLDPKILHRGIYEAVVYSGRLKIAGRFPEPDWKALKIDPARVMWDDAVVSFAISDLRGTQGDLALTLGTRSVAMKPGTKISGFSSGVHARLGRALVENDFGLDLKLNGSRSLSLAPIGVRTKVELASPWTSPKFEGAFLPTAREVASSGFTAQWDVPYFGRNYPQASNGRDGVVINAEALASSQVGVSLLSPVDAYRLVERSVKYAVLFIALVFLGFFLFEVQAHLRIHPFQYVLVGLSLCLFFLVLLSLSEFLAFGWAYFAASAVTVAMCSLYGASFLDGGGRTAVLAAELAAIYGYLYVVLQLEDYSLLMGTAMLVGVLAAVMYSTRRVDWYAIDEAFRKPGA